jgi:hypothetical protein
MLDQDPSAVEADQAFRYRIVQRLEPQEVERHVYNRRLALSHRESGEMMAYFAACAALAAVSNVIAAWAEWQLHDVNRLYSTDLVIAGLWVAICGFSLRARHLSAKIADDLDAQADEEITVLAQATSSAARSPSA